MGTPLMKEQWKCTTNATGVLSVIMTGTLKTLTSYVDSLATLQLPMPGSLLTLVKDQDRIYWAMLSVMEMSPISISVIIVGGFSYNCGHYWDVGVTCYHTEPSPGEFVWWILGYKSIYSYISF